MGHVWIYSYREKCCINQLKFVEVKGLNLVEDENKYYEVNEYDYLDRRSKWCGKIPCS